MNDLVVVGGGAAGFFAAINAKEAHPAARVLLLEKTLQPLAKVRISGGGRCNVTHGCFDPRKLVENYPRGRLELLGPFSRFQPEDTCKWFESRGVRLKMEDDGRMFPVSDSSETIVQCLMNEAKRLGVVVRLGAGVERIEKGFLIHLKGEVIEAKALILATGSSKKGWEMAKSLGHTLVEPVPSLFTFNCPTSPLLDLAGISVPDGRIAIEGTKFEARGPILLTHWGFSGPAPLRLSAFAARWLHERNYQATLLIDWGESVPKNLAKKLPIPRFLLDGKTTFKYEFVTAGGILLKEVNFKTFESKIVPGLFFAGEILDIDGVTGGFNFQNAWTSAWLASRRCLS